MTPTLREDLLDVLVRCGDFLDDRADVEDGDDGPRPNRAMSLLADVESIIAKVVTARE